MILSENRTHKVRWDTLQYVKKVTHYMLIEIEFSEIKMWFSNATWPSIWHIHTTIFWLKLKDCLVGLVKNYQVSQIHCLLASIIWNPNPFHLPWFYATPNYPIPFVAFCFHLPSSNIYIAINPRSLAMKIYWCWSNFQGCPTQDLISTCLQSSFFFFFLLT